MGGREAGWQEAIPFGMGGRAERRSKTRAVTGMASRIRRQRGYTGSGSRGLRIDAELDNDGRRQSRQTGQSGQSRLSRGGGGGGRKCTVSVSCAYGRAGQNRAGFGWIWLDSGVRLGKRERGRGRNTGLLQKVEQAGGAADGVLCSIIFSSPNNVWWMNWQMKIEGLEKELEAIRR